MRLEAVLFDLDGTLTDSAPGIMNSIRYSLRKHGMTVPDERELRKFIGPPLDEQFRIIFGVDKRQAERLVSTYREYYAIKGIYENSVYDGVMEMLTRIRKSQIRMMVATSKPEKYAGIIAEHFGFDEYFEYIGGACMDGTRTEKYEVIEHVLDTCGLCDRSRIAMVGDRRYDMIGAQKSGIYALGVLYGYGSLQELRDNGARGISSTPEMTADILLQWDQ